MLSRLLAKCVPPRPGPLEPADTLVALNLLWDCTQRDDLDLQFNTVPDDLTGRRLVVSVEAGEFFAHGAAADQLVQVGLVERGAEAIFVVGDDLRTVRDLRAALTRRGMHTGLVVRRDAAELLVKVY